MSSSPAVDEKSINLVVQSVSQLKLFQSQIVNVADVPWRIEITRRKIGAADTLAFHLHAMREIRFVGSRAAMATIQLLSYKERVVPLTNVIGPWVFDAAELTWSRNKFIEWTDLFSNNISTDTGYVKNNQIRVDVTISAKSLTKPMILYQQIFDVFQIHFCVDDVRNLLATKSFAICFANCTWEIIIRKRPSNRNEHGSHLDLLLYCTPLHEDRFFWTRNVFAEFHLNSNCTEHIKRFSETKRFSNNMRCHGILNFITWYDLMDPQNNFIQNNGISFTANLRIVAAHGEGVNPRNRNFTVDKRRMHNRCQNMKFHHLITLHGDNANVNNNQNINPSDISAVVPAAGDADPSIKLLCAICLDDMIGREILSTDCGHMFCKSCILKSLAFQRRCPYCQAHLLVERLHKIYLPL